MKVIKYPINCPLMDNDLIDEGTCFDIHMVVSGEAPRFTVPEKIFHKNNYVEICMKCKYHRFD